MFCAPRRDSGWAQDRNLWRIGTPAVFSSVVLYSPSRIQISRDVEPCEVLEAYDRVELTISGNGTHLAPWHAKLGFQPYPAIATLNSLSSDGGMIPCLELIVTKVCVRVHIQNGSDSDAMQVYPIAFIEFHKDEDGKVTREGPRREKDELAAHDAWAVSLIPDSILSSNSHPTEEARSRVPTPSEGSGRQMQDVRRLGSPFRSQIWVMASEK